MSSKRSKRRATHADAALLALMALLTLFGTQQFATAGCVASASLQQLEQAISKFQSRCRDWVGGKYRPLKAFTTKGYTA